MEKQGLDPGSGSTSIPPAPSAPAPPSDYHTRLRVGPVLILVAGGLLYADQYLAPWYPCLLVLVLALAAAACYELHELLADLPRPPLGVCLALVLAVLLANWPAHLGWTGAPQPWRDVLWVFAGGCLAALLWEMAVYREPGSSVPRLGAALWMTAYLGVLPSFLVQLRWWPPLESEGADWRGLTALVLTIFVPKVGDIGAYFTGRALGRHKMTPMLSPKKTWEGLAGGLAAAALTGVLLNRLPSVWGAPLLQGDLAAAGFGLVVGLAGVLGDLAESLIKRDRARKDASHVVPGFGGVLDVIDSVVFAAPVAYWWLRG